MPPPRVDNYNYLESVWEQEQMTTFQDFVRWYNNKDVVPTLDAMQKMMEFYHNKGIDMLKLGCTLPNVANTCLHKSTNNKCYPFVEADKVLHDKIRKDMTGGPSIVFTTKAVVDQTYIRNSENICKSIVDIDASQFSHLLCSKGDLVSLQDRVEKMDLIENCAQENANTKWRYALITKVTIFCALLNNIPMGCLDAVIPEQLLRRRDVNCLVTNGYGETYKDYICLFRAVAVHLYGSSELERNAAKLFSDFLHEPCHDAINFRGVSMDHLVFFLITL